MIYYIFSLVITNVVIKVMIRMVWRLLCHLGRSVATVRGHLLSKSGFGSAHNFVCSANVEKCSNQSCECDRHFVTQIGRLLSLNPADFNSSFSYRLGFNPLLSCTKAVIPPKRGQPVRADQCCGTELTSRYPFFSLSGEIGCCRSQTFDTAQFDCCDDGRLVKKGSRCRREI